MGKPSAFSALASLYVDYRPWLVDRLRFRLRNHADAEDLASETFLQVASVREPVPIAEPKAYLSTIARRLLFHFWRRRELEQAYLQWLTLHAADSAPSPESQALAVETLLRVDTMLAGLPPAVRAVFLYSQLDGLTYAEIGLRMGLSVRTVQRHFAQALERCLRVQREERA
ncbi:sigma-70 family RNA polymerase sigma factor [Achromobacter sp. SIMBA_011]|jgi:RNA polymerase sigma-70 factor (ECF subfamily)|uniref:Putative RNA polymerase sigma factor FecI n=1 Tax=Achromobacter dolens TaxID=1287738 RepID=A0A6S7DCD6_9BURK|nr:sigma-70 family RNA polymerase sigma factor [Achromobacter dolens]MBQ2645874.1 sigma-70 family RNA polymerase sigma factor [Achromobacter sp.]OAS83812.1 hypothetical protein A6I77_18070 [Achromobacter xylosoxidans]MCZ8406196.1 sigma-70 family RNA polymerase sigma factor [Achromobacter dolens]CAB3842068.1 putative RNA polymerase sigma factor FecI [Achromobacter dolens]CAB3872285.1 putative RNA polymerase sigma factor FecI [Achromobacter dolens]